MSWIVATNAGRSFHNVTDVVTQDGVVSFTAPDGALRSFPAACCTVTELPAQTGRRSGYRYGRNLTAVR